MQFPKPDAFSSLLRSVEASGTAPLCPGTDDASTAAGATASPEMTYVPSLCQITMDLMREPGVVLTAPRSMFARVDDVEKLYGFGDPGPGNTTSNCQVFIPLASATSVSLLEQVCSRRGIVCAVCLRIRLFRLLRHHDIQKVALAMIACVIPYMHSLGFAIIYRFHIDCYDSYC